MNRRKIKSSSIVSVGHRDETLEVEFVTGAVHRYTGVPQEIYDHLLQAASIGRRFAENIRGKYPCTRIDKKK